ncbi:hypothetical protein [Streptomyces sp. CRN 30]|uniref:hypothetical protein n=1 Tax=Streptomyces sp. CRN 30 TaxID=3075613 RepID=UPI002A8280E7|nr:hypothetical protein [Streptomyces sp. CRN 30]
MIRGRQLALWSALTTAVLFFCTVQAPAVDAADRAPAVSAAAVDGRTLRMTTGPGGALGAPDRAAAGPVTFEVTTTDPDGAWIGLARPHRDVTWNTFRSALRRTVGTHGPDIVAGSADLHAAAALLGGTVVHPGAGASFTQRLRPGTHWLFDYARLDDPTATPHVLRVDGPEGGEAPTPTAMLTARPTGDGPRFTLRGTPAEGQPLRFTNAMPTGQPAEAVFFRLDDGVTDRTLKTWFDSFGDHGQFPGTPAPFDLSRGTGSLPVHAGAATVLRLPLRQGRYVVVDWMKSARDGRSLAGQGQYAVVEVTGPAP